eukprot:TRINITY_DN2879_c0_g1_i1.p1 TRINITY_DN2879_c0_g1~~TRINITY_DN2879_c0_g1_i1.p1  ORF type:complete len:481 (-),score=56.20 TRINITY_DN2879_c0_g1_i1:977-2419(-)
MNAKSPDARDLQVRELKQAFERQRQAYLADPIPDRAERIAHLRSLSLLVQDHQEAIVKAISDDFGNRSDTETLFCEIYMVLDGIKDTIKQLKSWMKPQRRHVKQMLYPGAKNRVIPQPLGVVGVIVPWNFPANLTFAPLTSIFAAGNRAMVKLSDRSGNLARLLKEVSKDYFPAEKLTFLEDQFEIGPDFSALPFDHLLFTGSGQTGRAVMANAAANLTPVTLELGGKSPAIVADDFPIETAAERLMYWKLLNAGQICTTVDYLFLPEDKVDTFVEHAQRLVSQRYPDLQSPDYTSIIDENSYQRLWETVKDAQAKGATVINMAKGGEGDGRLRKFPPHILLNVTDDMLVMQREIFGPLLPIKTYRTREEVVSYVNSKDRPLALYPYTKNPQVRDYYIDRIISGGVSVNNCLLHVGQHDMPFGGVGASGMGHYHGYEGFITFSKLRPVFHQGFFDGMKPLMPPYSGTTQRILDFMMKLAK